MVGTTLRFHVLDPIPPERFEEGARAVYGEVETSIREALAAMRAGDSGESSGP
jgi:hypothetical protein